MEKKMSKELTAIETELNTIGDLMVSASADFVKFSKGNKAAGTRIRVGMQKIKAAAQDIRLGVLLVNSK